MHRRTWILVSLALVALQLALALRIAPYQIDDAAIGFRYAANFAAGRGLTYNPGSPPVEGFTNPAWVLALSVIARIGAPAWLPAASMLLGLLGALGCVGVAAWIGLRMTGEARGALPAAAVLAVSLVGTFHAVSGLDTVVFLLVVLLAMGATYGLLSAPAAALTGICAAWIRPEAAWLPVAMLAQAALAGELRAAVRGPARWLVGGLVVGGATLLAFRWRVFHAFLPNTYYAKEPSLAAGLRYLAEAAATPWIAVWLLGGLLGAIVGGPRERGCLAAALAWLAAAVVEGGDWMPHARLLVPALGAAALATTGLLRARRLAILAAVPALVALPPSWREAGIATRTFLRMRHEDRALASWIQSAGVRSVATVDLGELGFRDPALEIVDLAGLIDPRISRAPGGLLSKRFDPAYVIDERRPDLIVLRLARMPPRDGAGRLAPAAEDPLSVVEQRILTSPRLLAAYEPLFLLLPERARDPLYARMVYRRRDFQPQKPVTGGDLMVVSWMQD